MECLSHTTGLFMMILLNGNVDAHALFVTKWREISWFMPPTYIYEGQPKSSEHGVVARSLRVYVLFFFHSISRNIPCASHRRIFKANFTPEKFRVTPKQVYVIDTRKPLIRNVFRLWKNRLESKWLDEIWWNFTLCKNYDFEVLFKNKYCF